jgi:hypothetical protein
MRSPIPRLLPFTFQLGSVIVFLATSLVYGQAPPWGQALSFGGSGSDWGSVVKVDRKSNKYVAGYFSGTVTFGTRTLTSVGDVDGYVIKLKSDGSFGWAVRFGGGGYDQAFDIGFDGDENVYVTGSLSGDVTFGSVNGAAQEINGSGNCMFLAKYDPSGHLQWVQIGVSDFGSNNEGFGVAVNPVSGVVYMTGRASGSITFTSANGRKCKLSNGDADWHGYLVKYDGSGNCQWAEQDAAGGNSIAHKVAIDFDNNAYLVGWFEGSITFTSRDGRSQTVEAYSPRGDDPYPDDAFLTKYDSHGDLQWINHIGGWKGIANDVAVNPTNGDVTLAGFIGNIDTGDSRSYTLVSSQPPGSTTNLGGGDFTYDVVLATYNSDGVEQNASRIGGRDTDDGSGVAYDTQGNLYVAGLFGNTVDFGGITLNGSGPNNLFVLKFTSGALVWAKMAPGGADQNLESNARLAVNSATGKIFVTGAYTGSAIFGGTTLHSAGQEDIFLVSIPANPPD